jgi:nucleotide-binding universal stress UspA family protein
MYEKILVPLDGSSLAECVLPDVETMAKSYNSKTVTFVRVIEPMIPYGGGEGYIDPRIYQQIEDDARNEAESYLKGLATRIKMGPAQVKTEVLLGRAAESIIAYAKKVNVDIIVTATHGRSGVTRWVLGSVADRLLHIAPMPVLVVRAPGCVVE